MPSRDLWTPQPVYQLGTRPEPELPPEPSFPACTATAASATEGASFLPSPPLGGFWPSLKAALQSWESKSICSASPRCCRKLGELLLHARRLGYSLLHRLEGFGAPLLPAPDTGGEAARLAWKGSRREEAAAAPTSGYDAAADVLCALEPPLRTDPGSRLSRLS